MMIVIFDLDGTTCDIAPEYMSFIRTSPHNWPAFQEHIKTDLEIPQTMFLYRLLQNHPHVSLIIMTARPEECRDYTEQWLAERNCVFMQMYMRQTNDTRPDDIVKEELIATIRKDHGEIFMAFEDRPHVVDMLVKNNVFVLEVGQHRDYDRWLENKFKNVIQKYLTQELTIPDHELSTWNAAGSLSAKRIEKLTNGILTAVQKASGTIIDDE